MAIKTRFVYFFTGDGLDLDVWQENDVAGTNPRSMFNGVDGGYEIQTGTTNADRGNISFNDVAEHFDPRNSVFLATFRALSTTSQQTTAGLCSNDNLAANYIYCGLDTSISSNFRIYSDSSGFASTDTVVGSDVSYHNHKMIMTNTPSTTYYIDGTLRATHTSNIPSVGCQPHFHVRTHTTSAKEGRILNIEAFNT